MRQHYKGRPEENVKSLQHYLDVTQDKIHLIWTTNIKKKPQNSKTTISQQTSQPHIGSSKAASTQSDWNMKNLLLRAL